MGSGEGCVEIARRVLHVLVGLKMLFEPWDMGGPGPMDPSFFGWFFV